MTSFRVAQLLVAASAIACGSVSPGDASLGSAQIGVGARHDRRWVTQLGGPEDDEALAVAAAPSGVYIAGHTASAWFRAFGDACDPNIGDAHAGEDCADAFIMNTATGAGIQFGDRQSDEVKFLAVDGAVYASGNRREDAAGNYQKDGFAARYPLDLSAETWRVAIRNPRRVDELIGIAIGGDLFAAGGSNAPLDGHPIQEEDGVVTRITRDGAVTALEQFGDAGLDELMAIAADANGPYTTGATAGWLDDAGGANQGSTDVILVAHGPTLEPAADRCRAQFGTPGKDVGQAIITLGDHIYIAGYAGGRLDAAPDHQNRCNQPSDPPGRSDAFLAKFDKHCQPIWTRTFGTRNSDAASSLASDGTLLYVAGFYGVPAQAHGGTLGAHAFLRAYDLAGTLLGELAFDSSLPGTPTTDIAQSVSTSPGTIHVAGGTDGALGPTPSLGRRDAFLATIPVDALLATTPPTGDTCP